MPEEIPYSKREQDEFRRDMKEQLNKQDVVLKEILSDGKQTKEQVLMTNDRVTKIESWSVDVKLLIENLTRENGKLKTDRTRIYTIISVVLFVAGAIGYMYYNLIDLKIQEDDNVKIPVAVDSAVNSILPQALSDALDKKFKNIKLTEN